MLIMAPADENECRQMLTTGFLYDGPAAVRYPRGCGPGVAITPTLEALPIGKGEICRQGKKVAILAFGSMLPKAMEAAESLGATVVNMRFVKPLDSELVRQMAATHELLVSVEENSVMGGAGSAVAEFLEAAGIVKPLLQLGLPDRFIEHGVHEVMLAACGLDAAGIRAAIEKRLS
jgi:1-deoxy-D-xylulose-5-phosphate synthase